MTLFQALKHIQSRRQELCLLEGNSSLDLSESCIPSYCHSNWPASLVAWNRLFVASELFRQFSAGSVVLDFGAGSGELARVLPANCQYNFIEEEGALANYVAASISGSKRIDIAMLEAETYDAIFCLDSLEHNLNYAELITALLESLKRSGVLVLSGPTESILYRIGRWVAGFRGGYHLTDIFSIEDYLKRKMVRKSQCFLPAGVRLFSLSVWMK